VQPLRLLSEWERCLVSSTNIWLASLTHVDGEDSSVDVCRDLYGRCLSFRIFITTVTEPVQESTRLIMRRQGRSSRTYTNLFPLPSRMIFTGNTTRRRPVIGSPTERHARFLAAPEIGACSRIAVVPSDASSTGRASPRPGIVWESGSRYPWVAINARSREQRHGRYRLALSAPLR